MTTAWVAPVDYPLWIVLWQSAQTEGFPAPFGHELVPHGLRMSRSVEAIVVTVELCLQANVLSMAVFITYSNR